jgi:hypothetical protein
VPNAGCTPVRSKIEPHVCWFGARRTARTSTVALVGDSHAAAWRAAVVDPARSLHWHGLTVRRDSCPFSTVQPGGARAGTRGAACLRWVRATLRWFGRHREVHTVLVATSSAYVFTPEQGGYGAGVAGVRAALQALPRSVQRIVVLRDNPRASTATLDCVAHAVATRRVVVQGCAMPRASSLLPDPAADAGAQLASPRVQVIDLTPFFCDDASCFPVVGGAFVYKDVSHMTAAFAATLGPYLLARLEQLPPPSS